MTTAARPTFDPARGGGTARDKNAPIRQISARDQAAHTKLKFRQPGQGGELQEREVLRAELRRAEREAKNKLRQEKGLPELPPEEEDELGTHFDADADKDEDEKVAHSLRLQSSEEKERANDTAKKDMDADDDDDDADDDDDSESDHDDEDDTAALIAELEKIKRERAAEKARQEREQEAQSATERQEQVATGNPLLNLASVSSAGPKDFSVKRRWDDDVIFKNQARGVDERPKRRFINDTLRSDFHRKFMSKYVQ